MSTMLRHLDLYAIIGRYHDEEYHLAVDGIKLIQPLINCGNQVFSSLKPLGINLPLCNLVAEYWYDFAWPDPSKFSKCIEEIDTAFSCIESKRATEANAISEMTKPTNSSVLSFGTVVVYSPGASESAPRANGSNAGSFSEFNKPEVIKNYSRY